ncbi:MAG: hypothetical protein K2M91_02490, partial [Lachnospiraceae bacterium]|nr:hypothetical protein [Lachnospiraceae bacterium]
MGMLRSLSFEKDLDLNVWGLFKDANELGSRLDYTLEIVDAAVAGNIDFENEFKLEAYINRINHMRRLEALRESKKVVYVADDSDDASDTSGVVPDKQMCFADASDAYADFADACELQYAVEKLNSLNGYFMVNAGCDVKLAVRQALRGIPDSVELLKGLCEDYPVAADLLKIILGSGQPYESM